MPKKKPLSRERVLDAALQIVDNEGLDALTMRRLGLALGVEAMSVYNHVPSRAALLDGVHERILSELAEPPAPKGKKRGDWAEAVRERARAFRRVLIAHPKALVLFATRVAVTPSALVHVDRGLAILLAAGFSVEDAVYGFQCIVTFVVGHTLSTHATVPSEERSRAVYDEVDGLPALAEAAAVLGAPSPEAEFELGLDIFVRGLATKLSAR